MAKEARLHPISVQVDEIWAILNDLQARVTSLEEGAHDLSLKVDAVVEAKKILTGVLMEVVEKTNS